MQQPPRYAAFCCIWWGLLLLFYDRRDKESVVVAVELQHGGKGLTGQGDAAELAHLLLAFLLLLTDKYPTRKGDKIYLFEKSCINL